MQIKIVDEPTRDALTCALWRMSCHPVPGETLDNIAWDAGMVDADESELSAAREDFDARMAAIAGFRSGIEEVASAPIGQHVRLAVEPDLLAHELNNLRDGVTEAEGRFFDASPEERQRMLRIYDAARALMSILPEPSWRSWGDVPEAVA